MESSHRRFGTLLQGLMKGMKSRSLGLIGLQILVLTASFFLVAEATTVEDESAHHSNLAEDDSKSKSVLEDLSRNIPLEDELVAQIQTSGPLSEMASTGSEFVLRFLPALRGIEVTVWTSGGPQQMLTDEGGCVRLMLDKPSVSSEISFTARAHGQNHLLWWRQSLTPEQLDSLDEFVVQLQDQEVTPLKLTVSAMDPRGQGILPTVPLDNFPLDFTLSDSDQMITLQPDYSVRLTTNNDGIIFFLTNAHLNGTASFEGNESFEQFLATIDFDPEVDDCSQELSLTAKCPDTQDSEQTFLNSLKTWSESLGLGSRPLNKNEAIESGWAKINRNCQDDQNFPGYRYENAQDQSTRYLVLIYGENGVLSGVQVAVPKSSAEPGYNYVQDPHYFDGQYNGEEAFLVTMYFIPPEEVCAGKDTLDLICSSGLVSANSQNAIILAKKSPGAKVFYDQQTALANGWSASPDEGNEEQQNLVLASGDQRPIHASYTNSKLSGWSWIHYTHPEHQQRFDDTIFELVPSPRHSEHHQDHHERVHHGARRTRFHVDHHHNHRVKVSVQFDLGHKAEHRYPTKYRFVTDLGEHGERHVHHEGRLQDLHLTRHTKWIYLLGQNPDSARIHLVHVRLELDHGHHHHVTIYPNHQSILEVLEHQDRRGVSGAVVELYLGAGLKHGFQTKMKLKEHSTVYLDAPKGVLAAWSVRGPKRSKHISEPDSGHAFTPFHQKALLLKATDIEVHSCFHAHDHHHYFHGSSRSAVVEVLLEYSHKSQQSSREVITMDHHGYARLKNVPSPEPGESLNVTLISRIERQPFYETRHAYRHSVSVRSHNIHHHQDGQLHLEVCGRRKNLMVTVKHSESKEPIKGVRVSLGRDRSDHHATLTDITDCEGTTLFGLDDDDSSSKIHLTIDEDGFDPVRITRHIHRESHIEMIEIRLKPQQTVHVRVRQQGEHHGSERALGAVVRYKLDNNHEAVSGVNHDGVCKLVIPGDSEAITEIEAFLPDQSTCGRHRDHNHHHGPIYGAARRHSLTYPLHKRDSDRPDTIHLELPLISKIQYEIGLEGAYPDVARLSVHDHASRSDSKDVIHKVLDDKISLWVEPGALQAFLFTMENYNSRVILTPLDPCLAVNSHLDHDRHSLVVRHGIYRNTKRVTLKTVDEDHQPLAFVTIHFILGETAFLSNSVQVSEDGEVEFFLPEGVLVCFEAELHQHHHHHRPHHLNPNHFVAADDLRVTLVFDRQNGLNVVAKIIGDGFLVPADTLVRYQALDQGGDFIHSGSEFTNLDGEVTFQTRFDARFIQFTVQGSDGFDPVFYQPFDYLFNITHRSHSDHHEVAIEIPVKTLKNLIVEARDCFTGELLSDGKATVTLPHDAPVWNSWYDTELMTSASEGRTDPQGLVFFNLEPDQQVSVRVSAHGYEDFHDKITILSNGTYLMGAKLCRKVRITLKLVDEAHDNRPVDHALVRIILDQNHHAFEVRTDHHGKATFETSTHLKKLTLQLVDAPDHVEQPIFELHDDAPYFLRQEDVHIHILERMYTARLQVGSCDHHHSYSEVPILVSVCYDHDSECEQILRAAGNAAMLLADDHHSDDMKEQHIHWRHQHHHRHFVVSSDSNGLVQIRLHAAAKKVSLVILEAPASHPNEVNVGFIRELHLPKRIDFLLYDLAKTVSVTVRDEDEEGVPLALVRFGFTEPHHDDQTKTYEVFTNHHGVATLPIQGCVRSLSLEVSASKHTHHRSGQTVRKTDLDVIQHQTFLINLKEGKNSKKIRTIVKLGVDHVSDIQMATDRHRELVKLRKDPLTKDYVGVVPAHTEHIFMSQVDHHHHRMGYIEVHPADHQHGHWHDKIVVDGFRDLAKVRVEVLNERKEAIAGAHVTWHLGHHLGTIYSPVSSKGRVTLFAPKGTLLALRPVGSSCGQHRSIEIYEAKDEDTIRLTCH